MQKNDIEANQYFQPIFHQQIQQNLCVRNRFDMVAFRRQLLLDIPENENLTIEYKAHTFYNGEI